jgi:hypothetical protein
MRCSRIFSFIMLSWLFFFSDSRAARSSYESLYSGSGYMIQTDSGNAPYTVAGRFVVSMRRSFFNVAGLLSYADSRFSNLTFVNHSIYVAALGCESCTGRGTSQDMCGSLCATGVDGITRHDTVTRDAFSS